MSANGQAVEAIARPLQQRGLEVTVTTDLGAAIQRLSDSQLIILDAGDVASLALLCRRINDEAGSRHAPILAVAHSRDVEARVQLLEAGADDVVAPPIDVRELEALVDALMLRAPAAVPSTTDVSQAAPARVAPSGPGRVIAFCAAKGGSGTTSLAVNTALILAEMAPGSVAIADLDMLHGQVSTHLDIYGRSSTAQMAREDLSAMTPDMVHEAGRQHASGLTVFGGPYRPDEGFDVGGDQLGALADVLRQSYATVVLDVGSAIDLRAVAVLMRADHIVMPITPEIPSLRLLHSALQVLSEMGPLADKALFVLNEIHPKPMITAEQIEEHLGVKISAHIPYDAEEFVRAVNEGQPLYSLARRSAAAAAMRRLAELTAETRIDDGEPEPQRRGLLRGLLGGRG